MDIDVYKITADSSFTQENVNECIKSLNLAKVTSQRKDHVILIDSFDEFNKKKSFMKFVKYSNFPVIFTCINLSCFGDWSFPSDSHCKKIKIEKPLPSILETILERRRDELDLEVDDKTIYQIARDSPSIRKSLLALEEGSEYQEYENRTNMYKQLQNRSLSFNLNYLNLKNIIEKIKRYDDAHCRILQRLAKYDFIFTYDPFNNHAFSCYMDENGCLDKMFFNHMPEPIEEYFPVFTKRKPLEQKKKKQKKKSPPPESATNHEDISAFL
jgi:hypothetical protein